MKVKILSRLKERIRKVKARVNICFKSCKLIFSIAPVQVSCLVICIILQGMTPALSIWSSSTLISTIVNNKIEHSSSQLSLLVLLWSVSILVNYLVNPWIIFWQSNISEKTTLHINLGIIKKANSIRDLSYFESANHHDDIAVLKSQANSKPINLIVTLVGILKDIVIIISCAILLLSIVPWICILILVCAYMNYKIFSFLQEKAWQEALGRSQDSRKMQYYSSIALNDVAIKEIRFFNLGEFVIRQYVILFDKVFKRMVKLRLRQSIWPLVPLFFTASGNTLAFYYIVTQIWKGYGNAGTIALFLQSLSQLNLMITSLGEQAGWMAGHLYFFEKFFDFMDYREILLNETKDKVQIEIKQPPFIEFKNVTFNYIGSKRPVLKNVCFTIAPNEKIAIVGKNGAGKSTLIKLLCRLCALLR